MNSDIRWRQRFENYERAFNQLKRFKEKKELNEFEEQGLIKCFEYTYELAWNTIKDFLTYEGITGVYGSRDAFRQAYNKGLIHDGELWMRMIDDRIQTVHTYNEELAELIEIRILEDYYPLFESFYKKMKSIQ